MISCLQWLIYKRISVGTPTAEGARIEAPQAPRGRVWGGGVPLPTGEGSREGLCPLPRKFFKIFIPEW